MQSKLQGLNQHFAETLIKVYKQLILSS